MQGALRQQPEPPLAGAGASSDQAIQQDGSASGKPAATADGGSSESGASDLISRGMKSMFSDDSARVGTYDTFYGYGTVGTESWYACAVSWYGGYGKVGGGTVGMVRWVRWVPAYPPYRTHRAVTTVPTVPYPLYPPYRTIVPNGTAPFTVPSFLRTVPSPQSITIEIR